MRRSPSRSSAGAARTSPTSVRGHPSNWVLRRPPLGHVLPTAHDMAREHTVLAALADTTCRCRAPFALCEDSSVNGAPFYVMEYREGVIIAETPARRATPTTAATPRAVASAIDRHARRSSTPSTTTPSASATSAGPTATSSARSAAGASSGSARRRASCRRSTSSSAGCGNALPESPAPTIVHGDYRLGNMMLGAQRARPRRRHPRLGDGDARRPALRPRLHAHVLDRSGRRPRTPAAGQPGDRRARLRHARRTHRRVRPRSAAATSTHIDFYQVLASYKLA